MTRLLACLLVVAAACSESQPAPSSRVGSRTDRLTTGLCSAVDAASEGDATRAAELFTNEVDGPLHEFAAEVEATDRAAAADVLIAKNAVETHIETYVGAAKLARDLRTLLEHVKAGYDSLDQETVTCG